MLSLPLAGASADDSDLDCTPRTSRPPFGGAVPPHTVVAVTNASDG